MGGFWSWATALITRWKLGSVRDRRTSSVVGFVSVDTAEAVNGSSQISAECSHTSLMSPGATPIRSVRTQYAALAGLPSRRKPFPLGEAGPLPFTRKSSWGIRRQGASWSSTLLWAKRTSTQVKPSPRAVLTSARSSSVARPKA